MIRKRDGSLEEFDINKVRKAVTNAFLHNGYKDNKFTKKKIDKIVSVIPNNIESVEEIQDIVEEKIADIDFDVAKAYILYREKHKQIRQFANHKIEFIKKFIDSDNTANATIDDNSNVATHNIAVLNSEIHKEDNRTVNLKILENKLKELYPDFNYKQLMQDLNTVAYLHDSSSQIGMPYCVAITLYPFLLNGIRDIGGLSVAPKNIDSFCGMFVNLVFAIASQYKGAVAVPGLFISMDWFLRKEWGDNYHLKKDEIISSPHCIRQRTIEQQIHQYFQQICYTLMQPSGGRGNQAVFWNVSIFDKPFYETMYGDFRYPDCTAPQWESFNWLQKNFMHWLNQERLKCILTFPVVSACLIYQNEEFLDKELANFVTQEYSEGNSFFTYISDSADSLSSCCRLSSKIEKPQFNFTNGQLSEMTGSKNVITLNLNRITQDWFRTLNLKKETHYDDKLALIDKGRGLLIKTWKEDNTELKESFKAYLIDILERIYKYQSAYNACLKDLYDAGLLSVYKAGFISMKKQYLTIGINGLNQAAEFLGLECNNNPKYKELCNFFFLTIKEQNALHKTKELMFNTECTPCESAAIKLYNKDKEDGYWIPTDTNLYASYIYKPNDPNISVLDKIILHGKEFIGDSLDGGSSCHLNLDSHLSKEQYDKLLKFAAENGCKYLTFNVPNSECDDCGFITKTPITTCPKCGSEHISYYDRVIG